MLSDVTEMNPNAEQNVASSFEPHLSESAEIRNEKEPESSQSSNVESKMHVFV